MTCKDAFDVFGPLLPEVIQEIFDGGSFAFGKPGEPAASYVRIRKVRGLSRMDLARTPRLTFLMLQRLESARQHSSMEWHICLCEELGIDWKMIGFHEIFPE
jgi:hypothetical protein